MPDPPSGRAFAIQALALYAILAVAASLVDRGRAINGGRSRRD